MADLMTEREVLAQWNKMQRDFEIKRKMNSQNLILWTRAGVIPQPIGGGGWGRRKKFARETAAEIFAAVSCIEAVHLTLAQLRSVRDLGLVLETAPDFTPENSAAEIKRLHDAFAGKEFFAVNAMSWLKYKNIGLQYLFDQQLSDRQKFFDTEDFKFFVIGLASGCYKGYAIDERGEVVKPIDAPEPADVLQKFTEAESTPAPLAAKARE